MGSTIIELIALQSQTVLGLLKEINARQAPESLHQELQKQLVILTKTFRETSNRLTKEWQVFTSNFSLKKYQWIDPDLHSFFILIFSIVGIILTIIGMYMLFNPLWWVLQDRTAKEDCTFQPVNYCGYNFNCNKRTWDYDNPAKRDECLGSKRALAWLLLKIGLPFLFYGVTAYFILPTILRLVHTLLKYCNYQANLRVATEQLKYHSAQFKALVQLLTDKSLAPTHLDLTCASTLFAKSDLSEEAYRAVETCHR